MLYHELFHIYGTIKRDQLIKCPRCDKSFRKHSLRGHLRQHTNDKIYKCVACHLCYTRQHHLKHHYDKIHRGTKEFTSIKSEKNSHEERTKMKNTESPSAISPKSYYHCTDEVKKS